MANYLVIGGDGKQYGPVTADELRDWITEGRLNGQSLVQREGTNEWKPLAQIAEISDTSDPSAPPMIASMATPAGAWPEQVLAREPQLRLGDCLNGGMGFFLANFGFVVGSVVLAWLANFAMAFLPLIGGILSLILSGVITGGLYYTVLRRLRGEPVTPGNIFDGFKSNFVQLMLAGAITKLLIQLGFLFCTLPGLYFIVAWVFALPLVLDKRLEFWSAMELSRKMVTRVWPQMALLMFLVFLPFIIGQVIVSVKLFGYFMNAWNQVDHDFPKLVNWLSQNMNGLMKELFVTAMVVQAALLLSQFFAVGALMRAYENLFGERKP